jgi:hypothetical protein
VKNFTDQRYYVEANAAGAVVGESLSAGILVLPGNAPSHHDVRSDIRTPSS